MTPADGTPTPPPGRAGIVLFDPPERAPHLHETDVMSMPTLDPPAPDQMMEGAPYAYTAGAEGVQVLEFRGVGSFDMQITESLPRWDRIVEGVRANSEAWKDAAPHV